MSVQTTDSEAGVVPSLANGNGPPSVSVVIPCYNEEKFIGKALDQLATQYSAGQYEIIIVDGLSNDGTRTVVSEFQQQHPDLRVKIVDNPARNIPTALNLGVAASSGEIIARMDAHAVPCSGYIQRCVEVLNETGAGAVGMPCMVRPGADTTMARAVAIAVSHPFGIGDAKYRLGANGPLQEPVDTVAFACFRKSLWQSLGGFNEELLTNEDYDFNYRIRQSGKKVILDRGGHCDYFARTSLRTVGAQYWRYGGWKAEMVRLHPKSIKFRHLVAPAFVLSIILAALAALIWPPAVLLLAAEVVFYVAASLAAAWHAKARDIGLILTLPVVFSTIHLTWGTSFLMRMIRPRL